MEAVMMEFAQAEGYTRLKVQIYDNTGVLLQGPKRSHVCLENSCLILWRDVKALTLRNRI